MKLLAPSRLAGAVLVGMLLAVAAVPVAAQDTCKAGASQVNPYVQASAAEGGASSKAPGRLDTGGSGTGGIGGTGVTAQGGDPTGGIGGTGATARASDPTGGIGGTGIVGVITGFASVCVNGLEVQFDADTPVSDNGRPGSVRELAVGQLVAIRANAAGSSQLHAESIAVIHALVGPIEALDVEAGTLRVLGERAQVRARAQLAGYQVGNWVRLSGNPQADGVLAVTGIETLAATAARQAQIAGRVNAVTSEAIQVGSTRVQLRPGIAPHGLARGQEALVVGQWNGDVLAAQRMALEPTRNGLGRVRDVVVEGYVQELGAGSLSLGRGSMLLDAQARVTGGGLALNQFVRVTGRMDDQRRVFVEQVVIDAGGGPGGGAGPSSSGSGSSGSGSGSGGSSGSGSSSGGGSGSGGSGSGSGSGGSGSGGSGSGGSGSGGGGSGGGGSGGSGSGGSGSGGSGSGGSGSGGSGSGGSGSGGSGSGGSGGSGSGSSGSGSGSR